MMLKGLCTVVLGRCGVMSEGKKDCQRSIDKSNMHYSKNFKADKGHLEAATETKVIQKGHSVNTDDHLKDKSGTTKKPEDLLSEGPVERFKEEQSARENTLFSRKRRQLRNAYKQYSCGNFRGFDHAL